MGLEAGVGDEPLDFLSRSFRSDAAGVTGSFGEGAYGDKTSSWGCGDGVGDDCADWLLLINLPVESLTRPLVGSGVGGDMGDGAGGVLVVAWRTSGDGLLEVGTAGLRWFPRLFPPFLDLLI